MTDVSVSRRACIMTTIAMVAFHYFHLQFLLLFFLGGLIGLSSLMWGWLNTRSSSFLLVNIVIVTPHVPPFFSCMCSVLRQEIVPHSSLHHDPVLVCSLCGGFGLFHPLCLYYFDRYLFVDSVQRTTARTRLSNLGLFLFFHSIHGLFSYRHGRRRG